MLLLVHPDEVCQGAFAGNSLVSLKSLHAGKKACELSRGSQGVVSEAAEVARSREGLAVERSMRSNPASPCGDVVVTLGAGTVEGLNGVHVGAGWDSMDDL
eukprot:1176821-Pleurochrysis_carterae.AAC.1